MRPVLAELGPLPPWVGAALAVALAALGVLLDLRERRRAGVQPVFAPARALALASAGAIAGLLLYALANYFAPIKVRSWGTMLMVAFAAGLWWMIRDARDSDDITADTLIDLTIVCLIGAVIGSRLMSVALNWGDFAGQPAALLRLWEGGLSFHGGLAGGLLAGGILVVRRRLGFGRMADLVAPGLAIGYAVARLGCFLNGCCYGAPTDLPWGVCFPAHARPGEPPVRVHPTQLYAAAMSLAVFGILIWVRPRLRRPGHLGLLYLMLYSAGRFVVEFWRRGATARVFAPLAPLTEAQAASTAIFVIAGAWLVLGLVLRRR
jgi:phosphatidylglycerol:prolipoprotein diacylglycerol transferase